MQIVFQDPFASLNPRMTVGDIVGEPLSVLGLAAGRDKRERVAKLFEQVGLRPEHMRNCPHQFSGGQRQRICIARALALGPRLIICDEPVCALDVSIQAQVINLLIDLQRGQNVAHLLLAHDLAVVAHLSHRVAVMYLGRIVEIADKRELFKEPRHPCTQALLASVPIADPRTQRLTSLVEGDVPSPVNPPSGLRLSHPLPLRDGALQGRTADLARRRRAASGGMFAQRGDGAAGAERLRSMRPAGPRSASFETGAGDRSVPPAS